MSVQGELRLRGSDEAAFECDECGSLQCTRCELELHRQERMRNHDRVKISPGHVPFCDSCKGDGGSGNNGRLRAAVRCQGCKINLCLDCQKRTHGGANKKKHPLTTYPPVQTQKENNAEDTEAESLRAALEKVSSFLLVDEKEEMQVKDEEDFVSRLGCRSDELLKVVSIFGNTGEGKSHTLNHTFFWDVRFLRRLPLRTRAPWESGPPWILCTMWWSSTRRDCSELRAEGHDGSLWPGRASVHSGPAVIIFHETVHTKLLGSDKPLESTDRLLQERFRKLSLFPEAFSSVQYKGTRTFNPPTDFSGLLRVLELQLDNNNTRSPRCATVIYKALQALSERFNGEIQDEHLNSTCFFPDEYFTCSCLCLSCGSGCKSSMNHLKEGLEHEAKHRCRYSAQYDNRIYTCKACYEGGKEVIVVPKTTASSDSPWFGLAIYAWSGYVIECPNCGVIYRSDSTVRKPGSCGDLRDSSQSVTSWLTDQIAPAYWHPTLPFCRIRTETLPASVFRRMSLVTLIRAVSVLWWGLKPDWKTSNVLFLGEKLLDAALEEEGGTLIARKVGEAVQNTLGAVVGAIDIPLGLMKDAARPTYWVPDQDLHSCSVCQREFSPRLSIHHCRSCGQGVCEDCSPTDARFPPEAGTIL
ncbi:hypothetical protein WMY93_008165 [Mugilogobius chulae]|uniref:FYVE-type domain-containing protein n=1 Tax=Mugilogobius chulae TaxID=88201 RepID=A0AAW0PIP0_9GOBI